MPRKRKNKKSSSSKKSSSRQLNLKEGVTSEIVAIGFVILASILIIGFFTDTNGAGYVGRAVRFIIGSAVYALPAILAYSAIRIFRAEDHKLPFSVTFGSVLVLVTIAALAHTGAYTANDSWGSALNGEGGGITGHLMDEVFIGVFDKLAGTIILVGLFIIGLVIALNVRISEVIEFISNVFRSSENKVESQAAEIMKPVSVKEPTLNSNVPLVKNSNFKDTAEKLSEKEDHLALTTSNDPEWRFPDLNLLDNTIEKADAGDWKGNAEIVRETLADFKINVQMEDINVGPRVTQYTLKPPSGVRLTKITALEQNIALNLAAHSIRIEAPIPGKRAVGIEVPNKKAAMVRLRPILESSSWEESKSQLSFAIGQDIAGEPIVAALEDMPHLMIAGATGTGKSVMINTFLTSLLYRNSPSDMKLILIDPKQVELNLYQDIPHLLAPIVTEPEKCISALKWAVAEMERRYGELAEHGKRNIHEYNRLKKEANMPAIVIVIDELAELMMVAARDVESLIVRLAQKARATGIHLVLATQRPSVDVITGLIKANVPTRIAFTVPSQVDSRTIIDGAGAEKLLGSGDMLYMTPKLSKPKRIQGVLVDEKEVKSVTDFIRMERAPQYNDEITSLPVQIGKGGVVMDFDAGDDNMFKEAVQVVIESGKASSSLLQRRLRIGYARAARLIESMEEQGIIGPADGSRPREVLVGSYDEVFGGGSDDSNDDDFVTDTDV